MGGIGQNDVLELQKILTEDGEKSYVHCYRGIRRVANALDNAGFITIKPAILPDSFQKGNLIKTNDGVVFGPYPSDREFVILMNANYTTVVSLLSDSNPSELPWMKRERDVVGRYGITLIGIPLAANGEIDEIIEHINTLKTKSKIYVHDMSGDRIRQVYLAYQNSTD